MGRSGVAFILTLVAVWALAGYIAMSVDKTHFARLRCEGYGDIYITRGDEYTVCGKPDSGTVIYRHYPND